MLKSNTRYRDICLDVFRFRYLTAHHLTYYFHSVKEQYQPRVINRTLAAMERKRLVRRFAQPSFHGQRGGSAPKVVTLAEVGAQLVAEELGIEAHRIQWRPTPSERNFWFLAHTLEVANFAFAVRQAQTGAVTWVGETELKRSGPLKFTITQAATHDAQVSEKQVVLIPDGLYTIETDTRRAHCCLELDRGTITIANQSPLQRTAILSKVAAYQEFVTSGVYKEKFQMVAPPRITWVTTGEKRLQSLMKAVEDTITGPERILHWFTTQDLVMPATVLTKPIWRVAGQEGRHVLIKAD